VQSFTAHMPLLTATSTFGLGRRCWSSQQCYLHCLHISTHKQDSPIIIAHRSAVYLLLHLTFTSDFATNPSTIIAALLRS